MSKYLRRHWVQGTDMTTSSGDGELEVSGIVDSDQTLMVHRPWLVTWASSDRATLTPEPPTLTSRMVVPTWTPGEVIPDGKYDPEPDPPQEHPNFKIFDLFMFLVVGLPVIGIGIIITGFCIWACVFGSKKEREEKRQRALAAAEGAGATATAGGPSAGKPS